ncbi:hypothetical protein SCLCIDRAFT_665742 [Scleroderma citrinum Foug A]|uniref:Uncharacterized protein n=1 Tax=Scleroderma citrinum Foug A TaxID=1036808 RepID=A0A0C2ZE64_9AGAM|nr:hypothetical protein SCLCIDRAFT_665742 [Scleroderma citrinum Foug A]
MYGQQRDRDRDMNGMIIATPVLWVVPTLRSKRQKLRDGPPNPFGCQRSLISPPMIRQR